MNHRRPSDTPAMRRNDTENPSGSDDTLPVPLLRRVLDDVLSDQRFFARKSGSAIELAEHIMAHAAAGERDVGQLRNLAFKWLGL